MPDRMPDPDLRHIPYIHGGASDLLHDDVFDVLQRLNQSHAANDVFFVVFLQDIPAGIGIVLRDRIEDIVHCQAVFPKQARFDHDLVLLYEPTQRIHIDDIGQTLEERSNHPVLERPSLHQVGVGHDEIRVIVVRPLQVKLIDLA